MALKRKQHEEQEEQRRQMVLEQRRQQMLDVTNKFQRIGRRHACNNHSNNNNNNVRAGPQSYALTTGPLRPAMCNATCINLANIKVKSKVFLYSLPSVGPGADPGLQAVSPQVT